MGAEQAGVWTVHRFSSKPKSRAPGSAAHGGLTAALRRNAAAASGSGRIGKPGIPVRFQTSN